MLFRSLLDRLAADDRLPLDRAQLDEVIAEPLSFVGTASQQIAEVAKRVAEVADRFPEAATYDPDPVL